MINIVCTLDMLHSLCLLAMISNDWKIEEISKDKNMVYEGRNIQILIFFVWDRPGCEHGSLLGFKKHL